MAENVPQSIEVPVPLDLFGSLVTEMTPSDLPEGISPDNQDIVFLPGGVGSRPALHGWLSGLLPAGVTVTYQKTFVTPAGKTFNFILTSDGSLFSQDISNPTVLTTVANVTPGSYCNSVSAFGREFFTFHDNIEGTDIPRSFDGQFMDRATQGGPGVAPSLANVVIAASILTDTIIATIVSIVADAVSGPHFLGFDVTLSGACPFQIGQSVVISGTSNSAINGTWVITGVSGNIFGVGSYFSTTDPASTGGTATVTLSGTLVRSSNTVTANTSTNHGLTTGNQVQITGIDALLVGSGISSIVIDNENNPGVAVVTTNSDHGLLPEEDVLISGILPTVVGTSVSTIITVSQITTVTTTTPHGLSPGQEVLVRDGVGVFNPFTVANVISDTQFSYFEVKADATLTGGSVELYWPLPSVDPADSTFSVIAVPTPTSFQINISYGDGTWAGSGTVSFPWEGTFFVTAVIGLDTFQYQQYGPDGVTTDAGTVTPFGQAAPGFRNCVCLFQTRMGLITAPSPPSFRFISNGGQYIGVSGIPIGPPNVISRIIAFTGADGANYFYIPVPAQVNGLTVSTSTTVDDNTSTSALFDFSDATLFASVAIDIPGNNLFENVPIGPCLGVASYASRTAWWGMKNSISNLLNLGFEGGYSALTNPSGWSVDTSGGILDSSSADFGQAWLITGIGIGLTSGQLSQSGFRDAYNVAILQPSTAYTVNLRLSLPVTTGGNSGNLLLDFFSPTVGVLSSASVPINTVSTPKFFKVNFSSDTPAIIPSDTRIRLYENGLGAGSQISIDEIEIYPTLTPSVPQFRFSYVENPEALDALSGILGATDDDTPLQTTFIYRDALLFLTQAGLHETNDQPGAEPYLWRVRQVSNNCGSCSPRACSTGENFSVWVTSPSIFPPVGRGLYIYTGGTVFKLSQEIQPDFDNINENAQSSIWVQNDSVSRRIYVGVPMFSATAPDRIYVLDYREMDTASEIASKSPIHISFSGKMVCSDLSRKWTRWSIASNCGDIVNIPEVGIGLSLGAGNGEVPGTSSGFANSYWLDPNQLTDDDYGQIVPYYTTYFFVNHEMEQQIQVGLHRKLYKRYSIYITGSGMLQITPYANTISNPWPISPLQPLNNNQFYDLGDGLNVLTERCAFKIGSLPSSGQTDNSFSVGRLIITLSQEPIAPIRFGAV